MACQSTAQRPLAARRPLLGKSERARACQKVTNCSARDSRAFPASPVTGSFIFEALQSRDKSAWEFLAKRKEKAGKELHRAINLPRVLSARGRSL